MIYGVGNFEWGKMGPQSGSQAQEDTEAQWKVGWGLRDSLIKTYEKNGYAPQNFEKNP